MPRPLLKAEPDDELYVDWTDVADGPCAVLSREDATDEDGDYPPERFDRADRNGTSYVSAEPEWDGEEVVQHTFGPDRDHGMYTLRHADILTYTLLVFCGGGEAFAAARELLTPIDLDD